MRTAAVATLALLETGLVTCWARWRFGSTSWWVVWLRCLLGFPVLTLAASLSAGWMTAPFLPGRLWPAMVGVREEGLKLLFFLFLAGREPELREAGDAFGAMTAVALAFALPKAIGKAVAATDPLWAAIGFYTSGWSGAAAHVLFSLQAVGFMLLARRGSPWWWPGILLPMAAHSVWDDTALVGITTPGLAYGLRIVLMAGSAGMVLALARLAGVRPARRGVWAVAGPAGLAVLLLATTLLQVGGLWRWRYGVTVRPYAPMMAGWWVLGADLLVVAGARIRFFAGRQRIGS